MKINKLEILRVSEKDSTKMIVDIDGKIVEVGTITSHIDIRKPLTVSFYLEGKKVEAEVGELLFPKEYYWKGK